MANYAVYMNALVIIIQWYNITLTEQNVMEYF